MTKFDKTQFNWDGMYLTYGQGQDRKFVARFKRGGMAHFRSFLTKNFSVEEYFNLTDSGKSPIDVLETKGYVSHNVGKLLKRYGYPLSSEGIKQYVAYQAAKFHSTATA